MLSELGPIKDISGWCDNCFWISRFYWKVKTTSELCSLRLSSFSQSFFDVSVTRISIAWQKLNRGIGLKISSSNRREFNSSDHESQLTKNGSVLPEFTGSWWFPVYVQCACFWGPYLISQLVSRQAVISTLAHLEENSFNPVISQHSSCNSSS